MTALIASELLKLRSTRTTVTVSVAMVGLVATAVILHGYGLSPEQLSSSADQLTFLMGWGAVFGALFAGLLGALSFTGEIQHGTIRPTLLVTPKRDRVVLAKCAAVTTFGLAFGLAATTVSALAGRLALAARGLDVAVDSGDYVRLVIGGTVSAALWAIIGLAVATIVRTQVPTIVGLLVWVLFVEGTLVENAPSVGRFAPAALGQSISGLRPNTLLAPGLSFVFLVVYAGASLAAGTAATIRRDVG